MRTWIAGRSSMTGIEGVVSGLLQLNRMVTYIIARRQPTAGDLRMITGAAETITSGSATREVATG